MQKYATRGHDDIEATSKARQRAQPPPRPQATTRKTAVVAKRNAGLARCAVTCARSSAPALRISWQDGRPTSTNERDEAAPSGAEAAPSGGLGRGPGAVPGRRRWHHAARHARSPADP